MSWYPQWGPTADNIERLGSFLCCDGRFGKPGAFIADIVHKQEKQSHKTAWIVIANVIFVALFTVICIAWKCGWVEKRDADLKSYFEQTAFSDTIKTEDGLLMNTDSEVSD